MGAHNSSVSEAGKWGAIGDLRSMRTFTIQDGITARAHMQSIGELQNHGDWFITFTAVPQWTDDDAEWADLLETCGYAGTLHLNMQPVILNNLDWTSPLSALLRAMQNHKVGGASLFVYVPMSVDQTICFAMFMAAIWETGCISGEYALVGE